MIQITQVCPQNEMLDTGYGKITYLEWLLKESARINANPKRLTEITEKRGGVYLVEVNFKNYAHLVKEMAVDNTLDINNRKS